MSYSGEHRWFTRIGSPVSLCSLAFVLVVAVGGPASWFVGTWLVGMAARTATASVAVPLAATPELAEKEQRSCVTCHTALGRAELNAAGAYYREHGSFEGYPGQLPPRRSEGESQPEAPAPPEEPAPSEPNSPN